MGIHGSHSAQLSFTDMRVPRENLLMKEGDGFKVAMKTLDGGRIGIAAQAVGIARAALEASLKYAQERQTFGKPIAQLSGDSVEARRHGGRDRRGAPADASRGLAQGRGPAVHASNPRWRSCSPPRPR